MPNKAVVYENAKAGTAYVVESSLKVMTEQDYLATQFGDTQHNLNSQIKKEHNSGYVGCPQIIREIVIPQLNKEINTGANFAQLRQVYNSLILATWYKKKIRNSILKQAYEDKNKTKGLEYKSIVSSPNPHPALPAGRLKLSGMKNPDIDDVNVIYQQYLQAFKKGAFNYIKDEIDPMSHQSVPRKYFSGGVSFLDVSKAMVATRAALDDSHKFEIVDLKSMPLSKLPKAGKKTRIRRKNKEVEELKEQMKVLLDKGKYSAKELAKALGISVKTAENYIFATDYLSRHSNLQKVKVVLFDISTS